MTTVRLADLGPAARAYVAAQRAGGAPMVAPGARGPQTGRETAKRATSRPKATGPNPGTLPIVLVLPMPPTLTNASGGSRNPHAMHRARVDYLALCADRLRAGAIPKPPADGPWDRAILTVHAVVGAIHDDDNITARCKPAADFLVLHEYVTDDKRPHLAWTGIPDQRAKRRGEPAHLVLILSPET